VAGLTFGRREEERDVEFVASSLNALVWALTGAVFTICSTIVAFQLVPPRSPLIPALSLVILPFIAAITLWWARTGLTFHGVILSVGPRGLLDRRLSDTFIPWSAVVDATIIEDRYGRTHLLIGIDPAFEAVWPRRLGARALHFLHGLSGWHGYEISALGLKGSAKEVQESVAKFRFVLRQ
jgi:hypothetical protein